ncbi:GSCOCG00007804001-RA-CDS [Cotesia congregata]|nr:GSCOCG00007804001-RA-CDS [Cotesia congregata]
MIPIELTSEPTLQGDLKLLSSEDKEVEEVTGGDKIKLEIEVSGSLETLAQYKKIFVESCVITSAKNESDKVEINYGCNPTDSEIPQWTQEKYKFTSEYTAKQLSEDNSITIDCSITACIDEHSCPKPECPEKAPARRRRDVLGRLLTNLDMDESKFETINVNSPPLTISGMKEK